MPANKLQEKLFKLIYQVSTKLPSDVVTSLKKAVEAETGRAKKALSVVLENIDLANNEKLPICQDTGMPLFYVYTNGKYSNIKIRNAIKNALNEATEKIPLRGNAVDTITGKNVGNLPVIHFEDSNEFKIKLLMKGGGCENVSALYTLPDTKLNAERNLEGVKKCVLDAVYQAQGKGCPPYIVGVGIAGSAEQAFHVAKKQLLRPINDIHSNITLGQFEKETLSKINDLGIGPLGFGGKTTALAVKTDAVYRHPASYFVAVSFGCWATRRGEIKL